MIRERNPHTFGDDVRQMLERRLTFDEAIKMRTSRWFQAETNDRAARNLFEQLDQLAIG